MKKQLLLYAAVASTLMFNASIYSITTPGDNKKAIEKVREKIEQIQQQLTVGQPTVKKFNEFKQRYEKTKKSANKVLDLYVLGRFEEKEKQEYDFSDTISSMKVFSMVSNILQDIYNLKQEQGNLMEKFSQNPDDKKFMEELKEELETLEKKINSAYQTLFNIIKKSFLSKL